MSKHMGEIDSLWSARGRRVSERHHSLGIVCHAAFWIRRLRARALHHEPSADPSGGSSYLWGTSFLHWVLLPLVSSSAIRPPPPPKVVGDLIDDQQAIALPDLPLPVPVARRLFAPASVCVGEVRVNFDGCSHASGEQRGYVTCGISHHRPCIKYTQVNRHESWQSCAAWLAAWLELGEADGSMTKADHLASEPWPSRVQELLPLVR